MIGAILRCLAALPEAAIPVALAALMLLAVGLIH